MRPHGDNGGRTWTVAPIVGHDGRMPAHSKIDDGLFGGQPPKASTDDSGRDAIGWGELTNQGEATTTIDTMGTFIPEETESGQSGQQLALFDAPETKRSPSWTPRDLIVSDHTAQMIHDGQWAASTQRSYTHSIELYTRWCAHHGRSAFPGSAATLAEYVAYGAAGYLSEHFRTLGQPWSLAYLTRTMSAIRSTHRRRGLPVPDNRGAQLVLRTHERNLRESGWQPRKAHTPTIEEIRAMVATRMTGRKPLAELRDRCVLLLSLVRAARRSESAGDRLKIEDVEFVEQGLLVRTRVSKTGQGRTNAIRYGADAATCPVRTTRAWVDALARRGVTSGALFRKVNWVGNLEGDGIDDWTVNFIIGNMAADAKLAHMTGHSMRSGGATIAYRAGKKVAKIAEMGGWSPGSVALHGYLRLVDQWNEQENPTANIGL